ncbi:MAG: DNA polymerase III subunit delta [Prevotellaceae bacterium]|nr:DNA polymerase III subunit delta [Prevotellaceae bacterium]
MADNKNITFDGIMHDLKAQKYAPVYYLMGEEPYYIDKIADYIAEHALKPEEKDFNLTVMFGSDVGASQIADAARRYPMMAERQVVIVKEAQNLRNTDLIAAYLAKPMASTVLVMCHKNGTIDRRKKLAAAVEKAGVLFESKKLKERDLPPFIEKYLKQRGASIDQKSQQIIADSIGADLNRLTGELEKLLLALPDDNRRVTPVVVEQQIGVSKDFNSFELRDAIVNRNIFKANQIINYFDSNPKAGSIYAFLPMLFNYFQNLMIAFYCPQRGSQEAVAQWLELRSPWAAKDYMTGMKNFSATKVLQIIYKIREIDAKSKGINNPNTAPGELMKELIFFIFH